MTRAEVIRRTAKKSGVPDSEAKIFFEIFLSLITRKLSPGDKLKVNEIGLMQYREAKVRNFNPGFSRDKEFIIKDVVLFTPLSEESLSDKDLILFNVPVREEDDSYQNPDYHFSLSIGKPVIPLKNTKHSEFFIPPGGQELRHLLYSKAERLLNESEIIKGKEEEAEYLMLGPGKNNFNAPDIETTSTRQIEEEAILDLDKIPGAPVYPEEPKLKDTAEQNKLKEPVSDDKSKISDQSKDHKIISEPLDDTKKFERVRSVPKEKILGVKLPPEGHLTPDETTQKEHSPVTKKKDFTPSEQEDVSDDISKIRIKANKDSARQRARRTSTIELDEETAEKSYSRRRYKAGFMVIMALLVLSVAAAILFYTPIFNGTDQDEIVQIAKPAVVPVITERKYEIPVTYPYDKSINTADFNFEPIAITPPKIDTLVQAQNQTPEVKQEVIQEQNAASDNNQNRKEFSGVTPVKIKDHIYTYGGVYVVQVSSWKSLSKAESEVRRFNSRGNKAFLEEARLSEKGIYYRVRVGNFSTLKEAEDFLKKNI